MSVFIRAVIALIVVIGTLTLFSGPAEAGDPQIDAAQRQGVVGERIDGYLGVVNGAADPALVRKVNDINNRRRALYDQLAQDTGTTTAQVARLTGEKQVAKAGAGEFVMGDDGVWTQK